MLERLRWRCARPAPEERRLIAEIEAYLVRCYELLGIDRKRFGWTIGIRVDVRRPWRSLELTIPRHPADRRLSAGDPARKVILWEGSELALHGELDAELAMLHRHIHRERRLAEAGHDPASPPASSFFTDLIFRRALEHHGVDRDALVLRGSGAFGPPNAVADRGEVHRLAGGRTNSRSRTTAAALSSDFFDCKAEFDIDRLSMWTFHLSREVQVRPDSTDGGGEADVDLNMVLAETLMLGLVGRRLHEVVEHPVFDDDRLVILGGWTDFGWTTLRVSDPIVPLA